MVENRFLGARNNPILAIIFGQLLSRRTPKWPPHDTALNPEFSENPKKRCFRPVAACCPPDPFLSKSPKKIFFEWYLGHIVIWTFHHKFYFSKIFDPIFDPPLPSPKPWHFLYRTLYIEIFTKFRNFFRRQNSTQTTR